MASPASANEYEITQWTIASGGVIEAESTDSRWKLSGTIGQWEATQARALSGGPRRLTGGFWGLSLEALADLLFRDRFESETEPRHRASDQASQAVRAEQPSGTQ